MTTYNNFEDWYEVHRHNKTHPASQLDYANRENLAERHNREVPAGASDAERRDWVVKLFQLHPKARVGHPIPPNLKLLTASELLRFANGGTVLPKKPGNIQLVPPKRHLNGSTYWELMERRIAEEAAKKATEKERYLKALRPSYPGRKEDADDE